MLEMPWVGMAGATAIGKDLPVFQQVMAMGETLAHLEMLVAEGKVIKFNRRELTLFDLSRNSHSYRAPDGSGANQGRGHRHHSQGFSQD
jgi:hypothetical protein